MKLKSLLVLLVVLGFAVGCSTAQLEKEETYVKNEKQVNKVNIQWVTPSEKDCVTNGGKMDRVQCEAKWLEAKKICHVLNGRLPTIDELKKIVTNCGGELSAKPYSAIASKNRKNYFYQSCYKNKGFASYYSWSSTVGNSSMAWGNDFKSGTQDYNDKNRNYYVRCVR